MQAYSDPRRESEPTALPDIEVFELTAAEVAEMDEDTIYDYMKRPEFRLASMNGRVRERMIDAIVAEEGITGGWFWWSCFPGCMPDSDPVGPFETEAEALADAREGVEVDGDDFPEDTATVWDSRGFAHVGHLTEQRDAQNGTALYYFPGDFIAGDGTEAWLDPVTAADAEMLADYLTCDSEQWSAVAPAEEK